jgi:adenylate cyclase
MSPTNYSSRNLLQRFAKLVRQNQELIEENERLKTAILAFEEEMEALKLLPPGKVSPQKVRPQFHEKQEGLKFDMVTVIFARVHGFHKIIEGMDSAAVMDELDEILYRFDEILKKYNIQKIKTIGDNYMAAGGIPEKNITNPVQVVMAAVEMQRYMNELHEVSGREHNIWELRIGIHTGPVTASMNGKKKKTYDIKGDTVNMVSRLQGYSDTGDIVISVMTYELVKEFFQCEYSGKMPVKYKNDLELFSVRSIRPEFTLNGNGKIPNEKYDTKFKLIQFTDIQEIILDKLESELPAYLYYHNVKHTVDVVTEVELIGWAEGVSDEEILLLKTAALFHDLGHVVSYDDHEFHGTIFVREMLPQFGYTDDQINRICDIIMATKLPPDPKNLLQKIICDADLDYLGRSDMIPVSNTLFKELQEQEKISCLNEWNKLQLKFISGHQYFTSTARKLREVNKQKQIERIRQLILE